jgi:prepilin-type processing-associated H-X9-DG protein
MKLGTRIRRSRRGVTLGDVLVCLALLALMSGWLLAAEGPLGRARETANRVKCASNLRQIGQAMLLYANENRGNYPRTPYKVDDAPTQYTGVESKNPFDKDSGVKPNDVTAAIYLLIRTQDLTPVAFVCPSTDVQPVKFAGGKTAQDFGNFKSEESLGYSMANPYPSRKAIEMGYKWNNTRGAEFAMAADMNPGTAGGADPSSAKGPKNENAPAADMRKANSLNHLQDGQNVLYGDGHVEFLQNPFCGIKRDNIYTVAGPGEGVNVSTTSETITGPPAGGDDSVLLPAATSPPERKSPEEQDAADLAEIRRQLPAIKARLAEQQRWVEQMEKRIADEDAKQKPK